MEHRFVKYANLLDIQKKNIGKNMASTTWHPQLADKGTLLKNHVFWAILGNVLKL